MAPARNGEDALDGTLRAIVAADRLSSDDVIEGNDLLQRRLIVFHGYFGLVAVLATLGTRLRGLPGDLDPRAAAFVLTAQTVHASLLVLVFFALRFLARETLGLRLLDLVATAATASTAAVALSNVPRMVSADVSAVSFFGLFFVVRAALVPGNPALTATIAGVSAIPFTVGLATMYRRAGVLCVPDPTAATWAAVRSMAAAVLGVYVVSRSIYGLRRAVAKAVKLGQYEVHEKIGEGGMGAVYRASHAMLKRPTAIKVIPPDRAGETQAARFEREVRATSRLSHPNNIAIYDFGRTRGGVFYYAMELLDGEDLARLVEREGPQSTDRVRHILRQLAAALGEAHAAGLVHRDVKPANVMLCTRGGVTDFVKVLDFGLVKDFAVPADAMKLTNERAIAGTPLFMAPESILAPETVGPPADVYAVGCVAYFLLTGRTPFAEENLVAVCAAHVHSIPEPVAAHVADVPPALDALVLRCLDKSPAARPTARELERAFGA